jgi:hypothetical protein
VIAAAYIPVATVGAALSFVYDVGAEPGGDPADDLAFRGTGLAAPLFCPSFWSPPLCWRGREAG